VGNVLEANESLENIFENAVKEAEKRKHEYVTIEHVLLALVKDQNIGTTLHDFKINIGAVSLQFPLLHPSVVSVIPGVINEQQIKSNIENLSVPIPKDLWKQLVKHSIIRDDSPTEYF